MVVRHAEHARDARVGAVQRGQLVDRGPRLARVNLRPRLARAASSAWRGRRRLAARRSRHDTPAQMKPPKAGTTSAAHIRQAGVTVRPHRLAAALFERQHLIARDVLPHLLEAVGPAHLDAGRRARPRRARSARAGRSARGSCRRRAPRAPATRRPVTMRTRAPMALRFDRVPTSRSSSQRFAAGALRQEQVGRVVHVVDRDVDRAVVVDVAEGRAASRLRGRRRRAQPIGDVLEPARCTLR